MNIRRFKESDADHIARLFHDTVREVNCKDYSQEQVHAWAPRDLYFRNWAASCTNNYTYVAELGNVITGFAEFEFDGHIDCFYCHKDFQRKGIGRMLYQALENKARALGLSRLFVEASITARPFFLAMGFVQVKKQIVSTRGEQFTNYVMEKKLHSSS